MCAYTTEDTVQNKLAALDLVRIPDGRTPNQGRLLLLRFTFPAGEAGGRRIRDSNLGSVTAACYAAASPEPVLGAYFAFVCGGLSSLLLVISPRSSSLFLAPWSSASRETTEGVTLTDSESGVCVR